ncbi:uncharacterized protein LOC135806318 [Sycon ciliatum]|uniref:Nanos SciNanos n=1 Tax=Sycon ciliatum TaxID=27933 RepID=A0A077SMW6_9METZ|nr:Nanos SciNanos [Sycon ciliatum]
MGLPEAAMEGSSRSRGASTIGCRPSPPDDMDFIASINAKFKRDSERMLSLPRSDGKSLAAIGEGERVRPVSSSSISSGMSSEGTGFLDLPPSAGAAAALRPASRSSATAAESREQSSEQSPRPMISRIPGSRNRTFDSWRYEGSFNPVQDVLLSIIAPNGGYCCLNNFQGERCWCGGDLALRPRPDRPSFVPSWGPTFCVFCKNNQAPAPLYNAHRIKDSRGWVTCPVLSSYTCPLCGAMGRNGHTIKYCSRNTAPEALQAQAAANRRISPQNRQYHRGSYFNGNGTVRQTNGEWSREISPQIPNHRRVGPGRSFQEQNDGVNTHGHPRHYTGPFQNGGRQSQRPRERQYSSQSSSTNGVDLRSPFGQDSTFRSYPQQQPRRRNS